MVVRPAVGADVAGMAAVLADAFSETATFGWIIPDARARRRALAAVFAGTLRNLAGDGPLVAEREGAIIGVAVWVPPRRQAAAWRGHLLMAPGLVRAADPRTLWALAGRGRAVDRALTRARPSSPHWYLGSLGTSQGARGEGAGAALLRRGLERARLDGLPAYLEYEPHLVGYYERFGFTVRGELPVPAGSPPHAGMWWSGQE